MKNNILLFCGIFLIVLACKKETTPTLTPTDVTGTTIVKGNISKNIITPNGTGGWTNTGRTAAIGKTVSVKVNKSSLYPNSSSQGADVYSGVTDNNGDYAISVKTNANGVLANITIDGFSGTLDTLINGSTKQGFYATYTGTTFTNTLYMGQNFVYNYAFTASNVNTNPNNIVIGSAIVSGSVGMSIVKEIMTGTLVSLTTAFLPMVNRTVYLNLNKDPHLLNQKLYQVTTDVNGMFVFNLETVAMGTLGFPQSAVLWTNDLAATRDTLKIGGILKPGKPGVFSMQSSTLSGVFTGQILNANYLNYTVFTPD